MQQNKIWVNKGSKFYNRLMKSWLEKIKIIHVKDKTYIDFNKKINNLN